MSLNVEYVFKVLDRFSGPLDRIGRSIEKTKDRMSGLAAKAKQVGKNMAKIGTVMSASMTLPIVLMGKRFIDAASDAEETRSKFATIFRDITLQAEDTADSFAKSFGLAGTTARELLGDTSDMLTGFGFTSEAALELAKRTNELAVDLASFTNFSGGARGASAALTKALLGERESVKSLGIAILEEDVKKKIAIMRSQGLTFETERQAKAYATLEIALEQSKNAIGDYERTKRSFANVQRRVSENNIKLAESFGKLLIPVATKALNVIDEFQGKLAGLSDSQKKLILIVAALVAVLGPLLLVIGLIAMAIPAVIAGFTALAVVFSPIGIAIAAITSAIGLLIFEFARLLDVSGGVWAAIEMTIIGTATVIINTIERMIAGVLDAIHSAIVGAVSLVNKIPGVDINVGEIGTYSKIAEQRRLSRESSISDMIAASAARKSEQRATVTGQAQLDVNVNQGGKTEKQSMNLPLGGQMAGAS